MGNTSGRIVQMAADYVAESDNGILMSRDGVRGLMFLDEGEFIPFEHLGYNEELGFFDKRQFPEEPDEASEPE